jgi:Asp-tRNA(Asn)/Glu-tRNA(Gln) amidotransferase A subunit family amidase
VLRELAEAVRTRRVAARELVTLALDRIDRLDRGIGAVVGLRADEALAEAAATDERLARGEDPGSLAGIPCLIKDIEDLRGMRTTHGSLLFAASPPAERDGTMAALLRGAGAIPVGKANTPEFAAQGFTANLVFGATRNPWNPTRSPGGSSGGSGAALIAGMVPLATATDTGGSIRIPAAFCGLVGIKPTRGVVARDPALCWPDLTTCGPLAVAGDDLRLLLEVEAAGPLPGPGGLPRRVVAVSRFGPGGPLPAPVADAFAEALAGLERDLAFSVEVVEPETVIRSGDPEDDWGVWAARELATWVGRERAAASLDRMFPTTRDFVEGGLRTSDEDYRAARARASDYAGDLDAVLAGGAVIASPTLAAEGWLAEGSLPGSDEPGPPGEAFNTSIQNMAGHPAISVPAGRLPNGLPFGLQLTGPTSGDAMLLDLADAWQLAHPWPAAADGYSPFEI